MGGLNFLGPGGGFPKEKDGAGEGGRVIIIQIHKGACHPLDPEMATLNCFINRHPVLKWTKSVAEKHSESFLYGGLTDD